jgi:uncharacterized damage-inducible protein DinB
MTRRLTIGPERKLLADLLDFHRGAMLRKVEGLDDAQLRRSPVPSGTSLLGLVSHLTAVEAWWFRVVMDGQDVALPWTEDEPDADWHVPEGTPPSEIIAAYRAELARSRAALARHELDEIVHRGRINASVRWIVLHMISETARHNGHADLLRELIDGAVGE